MHIKIPEANIICRSPLKNIRTTLSAIDGPISKLKFVFAGDIKGNHQGYPKNVDAHKDRSSASMGWAANAPAPR